MAATENSQHSAKHTTTHSQHNPAEDGKPHNTGTEKTSTPHYDSKPHGSKPAQPHNNSHKPGKTHMELLIVPAAALCGVLLLALALIVQNLHNTKGHNDDKPN